MSEEQKTEEKEEPEAVTFSEFLESIPPSSKTKIDPLVEKTFSQGVKYQRLLTPEIQLHCSDNACNGTRFYRCTDKKEVTLSTDVNRFFYMSYRCSNCQRTIKKFSLMAIEDKRGNSGQCYKVGELPVYGPPTPSRLISLIGPDREIFLKGMRCENQGLGIGAFVYYRRVVENQKNRILGEIIKVSKKIEAKTEITNILEAAMEETQFSKALASVKDALPQALLINGQNPLTLLYSALSDGLHDQSDEHCLEIASSVRVVLGELSEQLAQALKDEDEINNALSKLMIKKSKDNKGKTSEEVVQSDNDSS